MKSEQVNELAKALCEAQKTIRVATFDKDNPFFSSKYASLRQVWEACQQALTNANLSVSQTIGRNETGSVLITTLMHVSGQWIQSECPILVGPKATAQAMGSAITYARRYSLAAICGVVTDDATDDDGNDCSSSKTPNETNQKTNSASDVISESDYQELKEALDKTPDYKRNVYEKLKKEGKTLRLINKKIAKMIWIGIHNEMRG